MSIKSLGFQYNALQMKMGTEEDQSWFETIDALFSENFTKIANGEVLVKARSELHKQIIKCREGAGLWKIKEKKVIPSADNKQCTIRYTISTEKAGSFDVIAILSSANGLQIDSIDEIFYLMG